MLIGIVHANAQAVLGGGLTAEATYCQKNLLIAVEGKHRLLKEISEFEGHSSIVLEGAYVFSQHRLHPYIGAGVEYNIHKSTFFYFVVSGIETNSFAGGIKVLTGKEEIGAEGSGVVFPWNHHRMGVGFFMEAIPLFHATYTGGLKLCYRFHHHC